VARPDKYACVVRLEKLFRNPIIEAVEKGGLAPRECPFDFTDDGGCCITHALSGSSFVVEGPFGRHTTTTVVGEGAPQQLEAFTWPTVVERVERWARDVKRDVDTPDLLAELQGEREILSHTHYEAVGNTPFSSEELKEIAEQLRQIKESRHARPNLGRRRPAFAKIAGSVHCNAASKRSLKSSSDIAASRQAAKSSA
jgi:hypothetical protein